jgi:hypothetical protein
MQWNDDGVSVLDMDLAQPKGTGVVFLLLVHDRLSLAMHSMGWRYGVSSCFLNVV